MGGRAEETGNVVLFLFHTGSIRGFTHDGAPTRFETAFLFHTGSIRGKQGRPLQRLFVRCFYSILVRLEDVSMRGCPVFLLIVSIPYWFD